MRRLLRWGAATGMLGAMLLAGLLGWNLWTYHRLTGEQWVADLQFMQQGERLYQVTLITPDSKPRHFALTGDDWQLDARLVTWQPWMQLLGNDPLYRLDRLSGRFRDVAEMRRRIPSVQALSANPGMDLWSLARNNGDWLPGVDAVYGSAVYVPMADQARYRVTLSSHGLVVRPHNDPAKTAVSSWY